MQCTMWHRLLFYHFILIQGASAEIELIEGETIKVSTDEQYAESSDEKVLYIDYKNIVNVVKPESQIFVDDGLISLIVKKIGE